MTVELNSFEALGLSDALLAAIAGEGYKMPSPIQQQTIPLLLKGHDVIGQAQTGTGKTAAFALPILQKLIPSERATQALILAPTRELANQVGEHFKTLCSFQKGTNVATLCGGQDYRSQLMDLRNGAQIVVGTPGRVLDHIERGTLQLGQLTTFVLDEADEMLRMGFIEEVEKILRKLPSTKQIALFSATMPPRIRQIANSYLTNPLSVAIQSETATVKSIEQRFLFATQPQKPDALIRILEVEEHQGVIVFVRTKSSTEEVAEVLQKQGYRAMPIHGDLTQALRERMIEQFKQGVIDVLVATDVAARGLDVERVTHVINYDVAHDSETYVHRIGRTGRAGRSGVTILFVTPRESRLLTVIERHTRQRIEKISLPTDQMILEAKEKRFLANITARLQEGHLHSYRRVLERYLSEHDVSPLDVAAALALQLNKDKPLQCDLPKPARPALKDTRVRTHEQPKFKRAPAANGGETRKRFHDGSAHALFRIDVGRVHGVKPGNIVGAIANEAGIEGRDITGIKIHDDHSMVYLPKGLPREMVSQLTKTWVCGRQLKLTPVS